MMLCVYCNTQRPSDDTPCPQCGAPSSLLAGLANGYSTLSAPQPQPMNGYGAPAPFMTGPMNGHGMPQSSVNWGGATAAAPASAVQWDGQPSLLPLQNTSNDYLRAQSPTQGRDKSGPYVGSTQGREGFERRFASSAQGPYVRSTYAPDPATRSPGETSALDIRSLPPSPQTASQPQQPSLLPVPYQGVLQQRSLIMAPNSWENQAALIPASAQNFAPMMPALPETEEFIHVSPMYIKPRAIIPRYRIISGLLSFLIVSILLCTGAGYYAKVTGKLAFLQQLWGDARPQNLVSRSAVLPDPPAFPDYGSAQNIINSASTASRIDPNTATLLQQSNVFAPGQTIYLTYSVHPKKPGFVTFKWYTNNVLYTTTFTKMISSAQDGFNTMQFAQPVEGKVELYWTSQSGKVQLAIRLFFVVR